MRSGRRRPEEGGGEAARSGDGDAVDGGDVGLERAVARGPLAAERLDVVVAGLGRVDGTDGEHAPAGVRLRGEAARDGVVVEHRTPSEGNATGQHEDLQHVGGGIIEEVLHQQVVGLRAARGIRERECFPWEPVSRGHGVVEGASCDQGPRGGLPQVQVVIRCGAPEIVVPGEDDDDGSPSRQHDLVRRFGSEALSVGGLRRRLEQMEVPREAGEGAPINA